jgi:hypothetical protein
MDEELVLPDFLNRKLNGIKPDPLPTYLAQRFRNPTKLVWPKKRNWRKIEARRRKQEAKENGAALKLGAFVKRKGQ